MREEIILFRELIKLYGASRTLFHRIDTYTPCSFFALLKGADFYLLIFTMHERPGIKWHLKHSKSVGRHIWSGVYLINLLPLGDALYS